MALADPNRPVDLASTGWHVSESSGHSDSRGDLFLFCPFSHYLVQNADRGGCEPALAKIGNRDTTAGIRGQDAADLRCAVADHIILASHFSQLQEGTSVR